MSTNSTVMKPQDKTKELVIDALFIALTFVASDCRSWETAD